MLVESVGDETVVYDLESKEAHCLKPLAALVFSFADGTNTLAEIAEMAGYRLGTPVTEAEAADAVAQLEQRALIDTPLIVRDGLSRRDAIRRMAGAAVAAPLIVSVAAPTAHAALTPIPTGLCCGDTTTSKCTGLNSSCESNHCCQNLKGPGHECNACRCVGDKNDCSTAQCSKLLTDPSCSGAPACPPIDIGGVSTPACKRTAACKCCYPEPGTTTCCVVFPVGGGVVAC